MKPQETFTGIDEVKRGTCGFILSHIKYVIPNVAITMPWLQVRTVTTFIYDSINLDT